MSDMVSITTQVRVTDENVDDMVGTATYGGISYWAKNPTDEQFSKAEARGADYVFVDAEEDRAYYITKKGLRMAFAALAAPDQKHVGSMIHNYFVNAVGDADENGIETGHIDSDAADVLVQVACFGKVVYG